MNWTAPVTISWNVTVTTTPLEAAMIAAGLAYVAFVVTLVIIGARRISRLLKERKHP